MSPLALTTPPPITLTGPAWEIALLFPDQGEWSLEDYLHLSEMTNHFVELCDARVEVHPMPGMMHQEIAAGLYAALNAFAKPKGLGRAILGPYPMKVSETTYREPDVVFALTASARLGEKSALGADLVVEVISQDRTRDLVTKRQEYAQAGIPEYWIIDPRDRQITVLRLIDNQYQPHGEFSPGQTATSFLLPGFQVDVAALFAAAEA